MTRRMMQRTVAGLLAIAAILVGAALGAGALTRIAAIANSPATVR